MGESSKFKRSRSSHQFVAGDLQGIDNKVSDSSEKRTSYKHLEMAEYTARGPVPVSSAFVTDLPGQREDVSRVVVMGVTCRPEGEV